MTAPSAAMIAMAARILSAGTVHTGTVPNTTNDYGGAPGYTEFDRGLSVTNGVYIYSIGFYSTTPRTVVSKVALENSSTAFDIVVSESWSHGGTGWEDHILATPYLVPGSGTYRIGVNTSGVNNYNDTGSRSYKTGNLTGSQTGFTAGSDGTLGHRWTEGV